MRLPVPSPAEVEAAREGFGGVRTPMQVAEALLDRMVEVHRHLRGRVALLEDTVDALVALGFL